MSSSLDPNLRQSPSGRHRGVGTGTGPQPVILQRKGIVCTQGAEYETLAPALPAAILLASVVPNSQAAELEFSGVQQNAESSVRVYVDFRIQAWANTGAAPRVEVQADLGDGNGFVGVPGAEGVRNTAAATESNQQSFVLQGSLTIPAVSTGDIDLRVLWTNGAAFNVHTRRTPGALGAFADPGGWTMEGQIVQYTP